MRIKSIELIKKKEKVPVYDITVGNQLKAQNFMIKSGVFLKNCGPVCHGGTQAVGSPNVFANGKPVARVGDDVDCGSKAMEGSPNVFINEATDKYTDPWDANYTPNPTQVFPTQVVSTELIGGLYRDKPEPYYTPNIKPKLTEADVPDKTHPVNSEQV